MNLIRLNIMMMLNWCLMGGERASVNTLYIISTVESEPSVARNFIHVFRLITIHEVHLFAFLRNKFWFACIIRVTDFAVLGERRECARESGTNEKCFASKFNLINPYYKEVKLKLHQYTVVIMGPIQLTSHSRRNGRDRHRTRRFVIPLYVLCLWRHFKEIPIRI